MTGCWPAPGCRPGCSAAVPSQATRVVFSRAVRSIFYGWIFQYFPERDREVIPGSEGEIGHAFVSLEGHGQLQPRARDHAAGDAGERGKSGSGNAVPGPGLEGVDSAEGPGLPVDAVAVNGEVCLGVGEGGGDGRAVDAVAGEAGRAGARAMFVGGSLMVMVTSASLSPACGSRPARLIRVVRVDAGSGNDASGQGDIRRLPSSPQRTLGATMPRPAEERSSAGASGRATAAASSTTLPSSLIRVQVVQAAATGVPSSSVILAVMGVISGDRRAFRKVAVSRTCRIEACRSG